MWREDGGGTPVGVRRCRSVTPSPYATDRQRRPAGDRPQTRGVGLRPGRAEATAWRGPGGKGPYRTVWGISGC